MSPETMQRCGIAPEDRIQHLEMMLTDAALKMQGTEKRFASFLDRIDQDDLAKATTKMWCIAGPSRILPGSLFHTRARSIAYAEDAVGIKWIKLKRMGYSCSRVHLTLK